MNEVLVRAVKAVDELLIDGEGVVLLSEGDGGRVVRISPLGLAVRALTRTGMPLKQLGDRLTGKFGSPPDGDVQGAVLTVVHDLEAQGLVEMLPASAS